MLSRIRAYPMIVLLLPLVAAILLFNHLHPQSLPEGEKTYGFIITGAAKPTAKCERFETRLLSGERVFLYLLRDSAMILPTYGDTVVAHTQIQWQHSRGSAFAAHYAVHPAPVHKEPLQVRLYRRLNQAGLEGDELATVGALTLGYKEDLDPQLKHRFQASGAAHVLAVSGLHTGILYVLLLWLLTLGGRYKPLYENKLGRRAISLIIIAFMWAYAWLTGMTPSVVRAVLMVTIFEVGRMAYRRAFSLNAIAAAAVLILLVRPSDLWSISFHLSFAASAAIVIFAIAMGPIFQYDTLKSSFGGKALNWILGIIVVSLAAQIGTLPITMYCFCQVSTYFLLTNLIVLPLATLLVPCGLISLAFGGSAIGIGFSKITSSLAWLMNTSVGWIESLPGSTFPAHINGLMVALYYVLLFLFYILVVKKI